MNKDYNHSEFIGKSLVYSDQQDLCGSRQELQLVSVNSVGPKTVVRFEHFTSKLNPHISGEYSRRTAIAFFYSRLNPHINH